MFCWSSYIHQIENMVPLCKQLPEGKPREVRLKNFFNRWDIAGNIGICHLSKPVLWCDKSAPLSVVMSKNCTSLVLSRLLACLLHTSDVSTLFMVDKVTREQAGRLAGWPSAKAAGLSPKLGRSSSTWPTCVLGYFWCPTLFHQNLSNYIGPRLLLWRMVKVCEQVVVGEPDGGSTHKSLIAWLGE